MIISEYRLHRPPSPPSPYDVPSVWVGPAEPPPPPLALYLTLPVLFSNTDAPPAAPLSGLDENPPPFPPFPTVILYVVPGVTLTFFWTTFSPFPPFPPLAYLVLPSCHPHWYPPAPPPAPATTTLILVTPSGTFHLYVPG